jgi:hypothetical protein
VLEIRSHSLRRALVCLQPEEQEAAETPEE